MRLDTVWLAPCNVGAAAVGLPPGDAGCIVLVGVCYSFVILFAILVFFSIGVRVAAAPEVLNKILAFLVGRKGLKSLFLLGGDDVGHIGLEPLRVDLIHFLGHLADVLPYVLRG